MSRKWWFGALLGWLFLGWCIAWQWSDFIFAGAQSKILASIASDQTLGALFWARVSYYLAAVLTLHAIFGLVVWLYARLLCRGFPLFHKHPAWTLWISWILSSGLVVTGNIAWYPASRFVPIESVFSENPGGLPVAGWIALGLSIIGLLAGLNAIRSRGFREVMRRRPSRRALATTVAVAGILTVTGLLQFPAAIGASTANVQPNVFLIGMDSLRDDLPGSEAAENLTPNVDAFLKDGTRFIDTTTPLARTFGSLVTVISGKHPVSTNARINLMPRALVNEGNSLPKLLRARGYSTLYATDEVRFANIDESYGFDRVVTPPIGATDFLLGKVNDLPLSNLISVSWVARWLFPHSWANRAVYQTYRPAQFTSRLRQELDVPTPAFAAIHLTLAHWPYSRAGQPKTRPRPLEIRAAYRTAVKEMDQQFGDVITILERQGLLKNALVVLLSDHGEALGRPEDSMMREIQRIEDRWGSMWGHGTSVMSPHQFQVVLAFRGYGPSALPTAGSRQLAPASLEDIAPTISEILNLEPPADGFDGYSLAAVLRDTVGASDRLANRVRFTETDFNTQSILEGKFDEKAALTEAGIYYEVDPSSGWVQLKADRLAELFSRKERAAISGRLFLAALPSEKGGQKYFITDRNNHLPRPLEGRPDPLEHPDEVRLWDALHARFPGEMGAVAQLP